MCEKALMMTMIKTAPSSPPSSASQQESRFLYRNQKFVFPPFSKLQLQSISNNNNNIHNNLYCNNNNNNATVEVMEQVSTTGLMATEESTEVGNSIIRNDQDFNLSSLLLLRDGTQEAKRKNNELCVFTSAAFRPKVGYNKEKSEAQELRGRKDCGEDAFFILNKFSVQPNHDAGDGKYRERVCAIGVADGVGGYSNMGVDPSLMAWALMEGSCKALDQNANMSPYDSLIEAYETIRRDNLVECGGSTACILLILRETDSQGNSNLKLTSSNLGDSAFMVIRDSNVVLRSQEQTHFWNCPFQMCVPPKNIADVFQDHPREADVLSEPFELKSGDVIIAATDGLTDNVFDEKIAEIISKHNSTPDIDDQCRADLIAKEILECAVQAATSRTAYTPFQKYAQENRYFFRGGKNDDICLVAALIR